jgi:glycosyltransferase involved in cell wall biosynthesis
LIKKILSCTARSCSTHTPKTIQTVATLRDDLYSPQDLKKLLYGDTIVTYSKWAKQKLEKLGFNNVAQIYPGFDLSKFVPDAKNKDLMQKWNIKENDFVVTYPGEFVRLGATDLIVDTFLKLWQNPNNSHIKYLCACRIKNDADAKKKQEIIQKFKEAGHIDKVIFTDTFADMNALYNMSDTIIFPVTDMAGKFDVPLAMIEPYACKKPVIASDLELFKEFSNENINVIVKSEDAQALKNAILDLEKDPQKRKDLGENAYNFAHKTFNIQNAAHEYEKIYKM